MSSFVQALLGLLDSADDRLEAQLAAQRCPRHPGTSTGIHACPMCQIEDTFLARVVTATEAPTARSLWVQRNARREQHAHELA